MSEIREISKIIACTAIGTYNLYTCPLNCRSRVPLVFVTNANGNNTVSIKWYRKEQNTSFFIQGGKNLALGESIQLSGSYIVLEPEDRLEITIANAGIVDALCTVEEMFSANKTRA